MSNDSSKEKIKKNSVYGKAMNKNFSYEKNSRGKQNTSVRRGNTRGR